MSYVFIDENKGKFYAIPSSMKKEKRFMIMDAAEKLENYKSGKTYTLDDIYALPPGQRAELVNGELYMMAAPNTRHQWLAGNLYRKIADYIDGRNGRCKPFIAPFAVFLHADGIYLEPDISVICDEGKISDRGCEGAPDWVAEIVSPSSRMMDYYKKLVQYGAAGVREYWVVDYEKSHVIIYNFQNNTVEEYAFSEPAKAGIFDGFAVKFDEID